MRVFPVEEVNGFVFGYYDETGNAPDWRLPGMEEDGWTRTLTHRYAVKTHPKETSENVIDLSHLSFLHGFDGVGHSGHVEVDGPCFKTDFRFNGNYNYPILRRYRVELSAVVQIWGLGFWRQEITLPLVMYEFRKNIERDFMVWENKAYNEYPLLTEADGEIFKFRRYCQQFYP